MAGLIAMNNGRTEPPPRSNGHSLKRWLAIFGETFQHNSSLSALQIAAYDMALRDLSVEELDAACGKTLQTWTFVAMPPPAFIRNCVPRPVVDLSTFESREPLSPAEAEKQWQEARARGEAYRKRVHEFSLTVTDLQSTAVRVEPALVVATNERLDLLEKQKQEVLTRFATKV
jgi:hypothetical protein